MSPRRHSVTHVLVTRLESFRVAFDRMVPNARHKLCARMDRANPDGAPLEPFSIRAARRLRGRTVRFGDICHIIMRINMRINTRIKGRLKVRFKTRFKARLEPRFAAQIETREEQPSRSPLGRSRVATGGQKMKRTP